VVVAMTKSGQAGVVAGPDRRYLAKNLRHLALRDSYYLFYVDVSLHKMTRKVSFEGFSVGVSAMYQVTDPVRVVLDDDLTDVEDRLTEYVRGMAIKVAREHIPSIGFDAAQFGNDLRRQLKAASTLIPGIDVQIRDVSVALEPPAEHHLRYEIERLETLRATGLAYSSEDRDIAELIKRLKEAPSKSLSGNDMRLDLILARLFQERPDNSTQDKFSGTAFIWTSGDDGSEVADALKELLAEYDVALEDDGPPIRGSWKQRFKLIWQGFTSLDAVQSYDWQGEVARRLEIELVDRKAAEVDGIKANTVSKLLPALEKHDKVVIRLGQIVIVKCYDKLVVETIDPVTAAKLDRHKDLSTNPERMLQVLSGEGTLADEPALQAQSLKELKDD
jgi:hypothetical protein